MAFVPYSLQLHTRSSRRSGKKILILIAIAVILLCSYLVLYVDAVMDLFLTNPSIDLVRKDVFVLMEVISFIYLAHELLASTWKKISSDEAIAVISTYAVFYLGFTYLIYNQSLPLGYWDGLGILFFGIGIILALLANIQRSTFYNRPENLGKIFTGGVYRYSRYINYLGEIIWLVGLAMLTRHWEALIIPIALFLIYTFNNIPKLDKIQTMKYGRDFQKYKAMSSKLVPFVY